MPLFPHLRPLVIEILSAALLATGFGFALFTYGTDDLKYGAAVLGVLAACGLCLGRSMLLREFSLPLGMTAVSLLSFFSYLLISVLWSSIPYISAYFILIFLLIPFIWLAVVGSARPLRVLCGLLSGGCLVMIAVMGWALYQYIFLFGGENGVRVKHPFLDPNNLAVFLNMALLPLVAFTFWVRDKRQIAALGLLSLLFFVALLATNSRTALVSAGAGFVVLLPFLIRQTRHPGLVALLLVATIACVVLLANLLMEGALFAYMQAILNFETSVSMQDRLALWLSSLNIFKDYLWTGTGLATFFYYYPQYRQPTDNSDGYFAHMDPLQIGLETGIVGYLLLYLFLTCVLMRTIGALRAPGQTLRDNLLVLAPFTGLLTVCLHMHMTFCLYLPAITIPVGLLLSWWYVATNHVLKDHRVFMRSRIWAAVMTLPMLVLLGGSLWALQATAGIYWNGRAQAAFDQNDQETVLRYQALQYRWSPQSYYRPYEQAAQMSLVWLKLHRSASVAERKVILTQGLAAVDAAIKRQPRHGSLRNLKAMILYLGGEDALPGSRAQAIEILRGILRIDPMMIEARIGLSTMLREQGQFAMSVRVMEEGMRWPRPKGVPDVNYIVATAKAHLAAGNRERHDELMAFAAQRALYYGFTVTSQP
ncbi:MAG: O-antigen ligase family protein [Micavibrio aeruginosavorus]|uniref:O-antigen ligase family protein n=1 Tax=Micavibrio aeruginosavorus TaxID=349221 RepID=A0A7T5R2K2_9BACT|nr:MAG: O-antigen ligase family protein [Micavibrio aeruginosavorus]